MPGERRAARLRALLMMAIATAGGGCGYGLVGRVSNLPPDIATIYIHPLTNATARSQADQILTEAIADEMVTRRRLEVISDRAVSDSELEGTLTDFRVVPVAFDDQGRATTYEIQVTAAIEFKRTATGEVIWSRDEYRFRESYEIEVTETGFFDREILALTEVSDGFAETLVTDLFEGF